MRGASPFFLEGAMNEYELREKIRRLENRLIHLNRLSNNADNDDLVDLEEEISDIEQEIRELEEKLPRH